MLKKLVCLQGRVTKKKEVLEVRIERGMENGKKVVFREKADEMPGAITGDVVLIVQQAEHKLFKRQGAHLTMEKDITLKDALCGYTLCAPALEHECCVPVHLAVQKDITLRDAFCGYAECASALECKCLLYRGISFCHTEGVDASGRPHVLVSFVRVYVAC